MRTVRAAVAYGMVNILLFQLDYYLFIYQRNFKVRNENFSGFVFVFLLQIFKFRGKSDLKTSVEMEKKGKFNGENLPKLFKNKIIMKNPYDIRFDEMHFVYGIISSFECCCCCSDLCVNILNINFY